MEFLLSGLALWIIVHFIPSLMRPIKDLWKKALGAKGYKISFSLLIVLALFLIIFGWRQSTPMLIYSLPDAARSITMILMLIAIILLSASRRPTNIKQFIRHPQLMSIIIWSIAHLLINGDSRSLVLFGGLGIWALIQIVLINRRDGEWKKPDPVSWKKEAIGTVISLIIFVALTLAHPYFTGVPVH